MSKTKNSVEKRTPELFMELARQNKLQLLEGIFSHKYGIKSIEDTGLIRVGADSYEGWKLLKEDFYDLIIAGKEISDETYEYLVSPLSDKGKNRWIYGIPYLIHSAVKNDNKKKLDDLLKITKENNEWAMSHVRQQIQSGYTRPRDKEHLTREQVAAGERKFYFLGLCGVIPILKMTIDLALDKGEIELAKELLSINEYLKVEKRDQGGKDGIITAPSPFKNIYTCTPYEFKCEVVKRDTKKPEIEKHIELAIHDGILNVDELIYTEIKQPKNSRYGTSSKVEKIRGPLVKNNLHKIYEAIRNNPIDEIEYWFNLTEAKKWNELKERVSKYDRSYNSRNYEKLNQAIDEKNSVAIIDELARLYNARAREMDNLNVTSSKHTSSEQLRESFKRTKESIIKNMEIEETMSDKLDMLDKEYFEDLLESKKYRDILIDLCVRLETILEEKHGYDGDLSEVVAKTHESNPSLIPGEMLPTLYKLIRCRNNAVHRKVDNETINSEELQKCINFICSMK